MTQAAAEPETRACNCPTAMHSMSKMCTGIMGKRPSGLLLMLPGVALIALGALIVIEPQVLVWLLAAGSVFLGSLLVLMGGFIRRMGRIARPLL